MLEKLHQRPRTSIRLQALRAVACLAVAVLPCTSADAQNWIFRRSYFSHDVPPEIEAALPRFESRSAYRPAIAVTGPGFAVRGGTRINRIFLRSGQSTDWTVIRQDWFDVRP